VRDVHISVEVEMRRSNGNYGWDQAMCQMSATLDQDEGVDDTADFLLDRATRNVERRLANSADLEVRRTMLRRSISAARPRLEDGCAPCSSTSSDRRRDCASIARKRAG
jgi:hypothetical protein